MLYLYFYTINMPLLYLITIVWISCLYFSYLSMPWLGIIPIGWVCVLVGSDIWSYRKYHILNTRINRNMITIAWLMIMLWLLWVWIALWMDWYIMILLLIWINIIWWLISYIVYYYDGKHFFHSWYYVWLLLFIINVVIYKNWSMGLIMFSLSYMLTMALYWFLCYIIGIFRPVESWNYYMWLFFLNISIVSLIYRIHQDTLYIGIFFSQLYITALYWYIYRILQQWEKPVIYNHITVEDVLAGSRITAPIYKKQHQSSNIIQILYKFLGDMPTIIKYLLSTLNVAIIIILMILFTIDISTTWINWFNHLIYRWAIICFIINTVILKILDYGYLIQRISVFFVLHFALYISAWWFWWWDLLTIALLAVIWNIINSIMIQYTPALSMIYIWRYVLSSSDYRYWIMSNVVMLVINVIIIAMLPISGQILFSLIFLYLWLQIFLMIYNISHISKQEKLWY